MTHFKAQTKYCANSLYISLMLKKILESISKLSKPVSSELFSSQNAFNRKLQGEITMPRTRAFDDMSKAIRDLKTGLKSNDHHTNALIQTAMDLKNREMNTLPEKELYDLGTAYSPGLKSDEGHVIIEKDINLAISAWNIAVEKGSLDAQYSLALCYKTGDGLPLDFNKALTILTELSEKDHGWANVSLLLCLTITYNKLYNVLLYVLHVLVRFRRNAQFRRGCQPGSQQSFPPLQSMSYTL